MIDIATSFKARMPTAGFLGLVKTENRKLIEFDLAYAAPCCVSRG